nr:DMT family transporter [Escherichia coli]
MNGQLGHWLQDGNACAVISFASGLVVMFLLLWREKKPGNNLRQFLL